MTFKYSSILAASNTLIEWVEYSFFLYFSPVIGKLFFPASSPSTALLLTYTIFAISYIVRPISGLAFGHLSDKLGRKPPMVFAMILMTIATLGITVLPTYQSIGFAAPCILLFLRILQSSAVSGELQSSAVYLIEHAKQKKIFAGAVILASASGGMFIGGLTSSLLSKNELAESYWRVPFVLTGILSFIFCLLRTKLAETPTFKQIKQSNTIEENPTKAIGNYIYPLIKVVLMSAFVCSFVYICNGYYSNFLAQFSSFSRSYAQFLCSMTELTVFILAPIIAYRLKDTTYKAALIIGLLGIASNAPLQFISAAHNDHTLILTSLVMYAVFDSLVTATVAYYLFTLLPSNVRCTGLGLGWNLAAALFGGTAPIIAAKLVGLGLLAMPGLIVSIVAVLALYSMIGKNKQMLLANEY